jgi:hypothetical protein
MGACYIAIATQREQGTGNYPLSSLAGRRVVYNVETDMERLKTPEPRMTEEKALEKNLIAEPMSCHGWMIVGRTFVDRPRCCSLSVLFLVRVIPTVSTKIYVRELRISPAPPDKQYCTQYIL